MQESGLRRHRDERAGIGEQDRLTQLTVPRAKTEPRPLVGSKLETVAAQESQIAAGSVDFDRVAASPIARTAIQAA